MTAIFDWVIDLIFQIFHDFATLLLDIFYGAVDAMLGLVLVILNGIGSIPGVEFFAIAFAALPPDTLYFLGRFNITQCMAIIVSAIGIRLILRLIPFIRLG